MDVDVVAASEEPAKEAGGVSADSVVDVEAAVAEGKGGKEDKEDKEEEEEGDEEKDAKGEEGDENESSTPSPASLIRKPYFESTYCDDDLRVGRTGNGDMFVSVRA